MRALRQYLKSAPAGMLIRKGIDALRRLREAICRAVCSESMCSRAKGTYRYWSNCRRLKPLIKNERRLLLDSREQHKVVRWANDRKPLVSVVIPTWNRGELLAARTIPSVLTQTYPQLEIIIVGDCCTDNTAQLLASLNDPRIHFLNLPERGQYPSGKKALWQVAGSVPKNKGLDLCKGNWIAPLDDDDMFTPDHIESLLHYAQENDLELVYGRLRIEEAAGRWKEKGLVNKHMSIQNSTMLFRSYVKLFRSDINAWRVGLTGDYHRTIRFRETGVRIGYLDKIVALMPLRPGQTKIGLSAHDRPEAAVISAPARMGSQ